MSTASQEPRPEEAGTSPKPSNQENQDPTQGGSLRKMFVDGLTNIAGTSRTESNLFQALDKRDLTDEEQRVIDERVAHQRRMYEEFNRRENSRKIRELLEVCPDLSEKEAEMALEMCNGREDEAANLLVTDHTFVNQVKNGYMLPPQQRSTRQPRNNNNNGGGGGSRRAGPRPKIVDPSTLGDNVFVGQFRGKGFSGASTSRPAVPYTKTTAAAAAKSKATRVQEEQEEEAIIEEEEWNGEVVEEEEGANVASRTRGGRRRSSMGTATKKQQPSAGKTKTTRPIKSETDSEEEEDVIEDEEMDVEEKEGTPAGKEEAAANGGAVEVPTTGRPKVHQLVVETSQGDIRPATDSEVKRAQQQATNDDGSFSDDDDAVPVAAAVVPSTQRRGSRPTRAAAAQAAAGFVDGPAEGDDDDEEEDDDGNGGGSRDVRPSMLATMAAKLETMSDADAADWLNRMSAHMRVAALQQFGAEEPIRAVMISELLTTATQEEEAPAPPTTEEQEEEEEEAPVAADVMVVDEVAVVKEQQKQQQQPTAARRATRSTPSKKQKKPVVPSNNSDSSSSEDDSSDESTEILGEEEEKKKEGSKSPSSGQQGQRKRGSGQLGGKKSAGGVDSGGWKKAKRDGDGEATAMALDNAVDNNNNPAGATTTDEDLSGGSDGSGNNITITNAMPPPPAVPVAAAAGGRRSNGRGRSNAISSRGHTTRGRVKQKSHKAADLVAAGTLRKAKGWYNAGYIFPEGFHSRTLFRSSVALDQLCVHECYVLGKEGEHWPAPTFKLVAMDRPDEPIIAKSCTGCWSGILKRINSEIEHRRKNGEDLPPPPRTAIAGPEYFGFNQPNIVESVEALDPDHTCEEYWAGKQDRERAAAGLPATTNPNKPARAPRAATTRAPRGGRGRGRRAGQSDDEDDHHDDDEDNDETQYTTNRWSAVNRGERYKKRLEDLGEDTSGVDEDNPLPGFMDPITLEEVVRPAISPYGHVMGAATWRAVLAESNNVCPFTKQALKWEQCRVLTNSNIDAYRDRIIS